VVGEGRHVYDRIETSPEGAVNCFLRDFSGSTFDHSKGSLRIDRSGFDDIGIHEITGWYRNQWTLV
jgi:hypothetical protein